MNMNGNANGRGLSHKKLIILTAAAAILLIAGIVAVVLLTTGGRSGVTGTLEQYFQTMYTANGKSFEEMADCFAPEISQEWYNGMTIGGTNFYALSNWRMEAMEQVGANAACRVKITEQKSGSATELTQIKQTFRGAQALKDVIFQLDIDGDTGSLVTHGVAELVKIDGKWYFASTSIPLAVKSRTGSAQEWYEAHGDKENN